ncbi:MAG: glutathione peroxidase [Methanomicrobiales archaeon HGW-Methanomicrobiales-4]|nr:MAG: glutathione peroxidase [Methanomicrobiales archaeon HGW-Methanomicrobiales-4]
MSFYDISFLDSYGSSVRMSEFRGKVVLIVNTATKCGLAGQFNELETLYQSYKDKGLEVIGFPCDQFFGQEPETNENMVKVCLINFGVTFLLSEKIKVNGKDTHPLFVYLKKELPGSIFGGSIKWNFTKFLITREGVSFKRYSPLTKPADIERDIVELLNQ